MQHQILRALIDREREREEERKKEGERKKEREGGKERGEKTRKNEVKGMKYD